MTGILTLPTLTSPARSKRFSIQTQTRSLDFYPLQTRLLLKGETIYSNQPSSFELSSSFETKENSTDLSSQAPSLSVKDLTFIVNNMGLWTIAETGTATAPEDDDTKEIENKLQSLFCSAKEEDFEDGMESKFSRNLIALIQQYDELAIDILAELIVSHDVNLSVAAEALRWIGWMNHPYTHQKRRWLIEHALTSPYARIRDGAILGISYMDDPLSIHSLKWAIEHEKIASLRHDMEQVLSQLVETQSAG